MNASIRKENEVRRHAVASAVSSLKELVTIIMALTIATAITQVIQGKKVLATPALTMDALSTPMALCVLLLFNVIRFYHGNIRHLDDTYIIRSRHKPTADIRAGVSNSIALDFVVIVCQSILLSVQSFLFQSPQTYYCLFMALLLVDVIWIGVRITHGDSKKRFMHQKYWASANGAALLGMLIIEACRDQIAHPFFWLFACLFAATIADFILSWDFYFPKQRTFPTDGAWDIFFAAPFTQEYDSDTGSIQIPFRKRLELAYSALESRGHRITCAHRREKWGAKLEPPKTAWQNDRAAIKQADAVIAYLGNPISPGVMMEIGVASDNGIPIVILRDENGACPYLLRGDDGDRPFDESIWAESFPCDGVVGLLKRQMKNHDLMNAQEAEPYGSPATGSP